MNTTKRKRGIDAAGFRRTPMALGPFGPLIEHYGLVWVLTWSDLRSTYARSFFGLFWLVMLPVFYVAVFVAVRILLFDRSATSPDWEGAALGIGDVQMLAIQIFMGFIVFWEASEILNRSPTAIRSNSNMVQGSVFPIEMLPWITVITALFNMMVRIAIFLVAYLAIVRGFQATTFLFPIVVAPLVFMMIGIAYLFATIGTYFRDLDYILTAMTTGLLLLSAVIFPLSEVPPAYKPFIIYNPIAMAIEQARLVVVLGRMPDWEYLGWAALVGVALSWMGFSVFRRFRGGFADVL